MKAVGSKYLMVSDIGHRETGLKAYEEAADVFNEAGWKCKEAKITFCYHNHSWEFGKFEGGTQDSTGSMSLQTPSPSNCAWTYIGSSTEAKTRQISSKGI
jgi:hypothetical protein